MRVHMHVRMRVHMHVRMPVHLSVGMCIGMSVDMCALCNGMYPVWSMPHVMVCIPCGLCLM